jgi:hypothetical protein
MLLIASPNLFDDPQARLFLERVQVVTGVMFGMVSGSGSGRLAGASRESLGSEMAWLQTSAEPLIARLPAEYRSVLEVATLDSDGASTGGDGAQAGRRRRA